MHRPADHKPANITARLPRRTVPLFLAVLLALVMPGSPDAGASDRILPAGPRPVRNWPVILGNSISFTPAVADIDGDGRDEIAVGIRDCRVFLLDDDGRNMPGWPRETVSRIFRGPLLEDVDGYGGYEIAAPSFAGLLHMWHEDGSVVDGWPVDLGGRAVSQPQLVRCPRTGRRSILVSTHPGTVHLLSPGGEERDGWPRRLDHVTAAGQMNGWPTWQADLDGDGAPEILHLETDPVVIHAWKLDGSAIRGFPVETGQNSGIGMAVDDRADPRRIAYTTNSHLNILDLTSGTAVTVAHDPADHRFVSPPYFISSYGREGGRPDLILASAVSGAVYLWTIDGRPVEGWPVYLDGFIYGLREDEEKHMVYGPPIAADVDGDGEREIILGCYDHHLYCFEFDGACVTGWPVVLDDFIVQGLALAQLDGEGAMELVAGQYGETLFAFHIDATEPVVPPAGKHAYQTRSEWPPGYYSVSAIIAVMLFLLVHLLRKELAGSSRSRRRDAVGILSFILLVLILRMLFLAGDLFRYREAMDEIRKAGQTVELVMNDIREEAREQVEGFAEELSMCRPHELTDPHKALRCLERLSDRHRLEYRFTGVVLADGTGRIIRGVGLGRGWEDLEQLGLYSSCPGDPLLLGDIPVFAVESASGISAAGDTLRLFFLSSMLNRLPNALADRTGFSAHIRVDGRTMAWGGAGPRPYRSFRPWLGMVQPSMEIEMAHPPDGPRLAVLLAMEDFERARSGWLDLAAVLILPILYIIFAGRRRLSERVRLRWWWVIVFGSLYVLGEVLLHHGRLETGPVPLSGRVLEVLLHMAGVTGVVVALHRVVTSRRSRRLNFALLGSYLIVSLIPLTVLLLAGVNFFSVMQRGVIENTIAELESRADNMVLAYMGNRTFDNRLIRESRDLLDLSTETSWLNFIEENKYLFNYDLPTAYITLWAHDRDDPERYFTGYSYAAPRTGKLYDTRPAWTGGDVVKGFFLDNGTAVVRAMRTYRSAGLDMELAAHIPIDDSILDELEERLRLLPFLPRIHLEPSWLESSAVRGRPDGLYFPYASELVLQAYGWSSGKPRWAVYRANMYIPTGREMVQVLISVMLIILLPLGLSLWGAYTTFRRTARPLTRLLTGITRVGDGDLEYRLGDTGKTEIGVAARAFDSMADSLEETIQELAEKRKVEEISELKSHFISMVSHDLKTPLSSIQGAAGNMLEELPGPLTERQRTYLEMILKSGEDLQRMITDLLDLSRIESGRLELAVQPLDIGREANDCLRSMQPLFEEKGIKGVVEVRAEDPTVFGDRARVLQVLTNIISNAMRHSPDGGTIGIRIESIPVDETDGRPMTRISVRDEGPGITESEVSQLFEPFFYRSAGKAGAHGAGLGLAIVKQLVELHGGTVVLRNSSAGGAVFSFTLPA